MLFYEEKEYNNNYGNHIQFLEFYIVLCHGYYNYSHWLGQHSFD